MYLGFLQFKYNFVDGQNNSKYRDVSTGILGYLFLSYP